MEADKEKMCAINKLYAHNSLKVPLILQMELGVAPFSDG